MEVALPHRVAQARQPGRAGGPATPPTNNDNSSSPKQHFERREDYQRVSAHIGNKHALQWPSTEDRASLMERISVSTLRAGMVLPLLQIGDGSRDICCDIISGTGQSHTPIDNSIKEPDMRTSTPTVLKACSAPNSVVMADAAICARGNTWGQHVCNLASTQCPLTAPDTPLAHRLLALAWEPLNNIGPETPKQAARADGALIPTNDFCCVPIFEKVTSNVFFLTKNVLSPAIVPNRNFLLLTQQSPQPSATCKSQTRCKTFRHPYYRVVRS